MRTRTFFIEAIAILFVLLWVYAAVSKLATFQTFQDQLAKSPYITNIVPLAAWGIPLFELLVAGLLVFNRTKLLGMYASFFLMALFSGYIYAMLNYSHYVPCACGGIFAKLGWTEHLIINILLTVIALAGIILMVKKQNRADRDRPYQLDAHGNRLINLKS